MGYECDYPGMLKLNRVCGMKKPTSPPADLNDPCKATLEATLSKNFEIAIVSAKEISNFYR